MAGIGLFAALDISISGMMASRLATQVVNHNVANANTPGYSRQTLQTAAAHPLGLTFGVIGRGVEVGSITRQRSNFLERQLVDQNAILGEYAAMDNSLRSVEEILGSMNNDRIGTAMNDFFASWSDLATAPTDEDGKRQSVISHATRLATEFNEVDSALADLEREARTTFDTYVDDVNLLLQGVARLNEDIVTNTVGEQLPNDLIDARGQLLDELSNLTGFKLNERADGSVDVSVEGRNLVTRGHVNELRVEEEEVSGGAIVRKAVFGGRNPVSVDFKSGALAGHQEVVNSKLPALREKLDALAVDLMDQVNSLHRQGVTTVGSGLDLFVGTSAATMVVNPAVMSDLRHLATGRSGAAGDNEIALAIAALGNTVQPGTDRTLNDHYAQMIVSVATDRGTYESLREGQIAVVETVRTRLDSERGVNLDEELANLVMYQRTYEANARMIRAIDEMLDTLVNGMI